MLWAELYLSTKSYVDILVPSTSQWDFIWGL